jgi:uncharacterized protein YbjT (DUF2867 family)
LKGKIPRVGFGHSREVKMNLVVGGTGVLGGMVTRRLLDRGEPVRILVRESSKFEDLEDYGAEIAIGDLKRPETLPEALAGVRRVVSTATASARGGEDSIESVDGRGTRDLINVASFAGIEQFVYVSAHGFEAASPDPLARAKGCNEIHLKSIGVPYTILKPALFMEAWIAFVVGSQLGSGRIGILGDGTHKHGFVAVRNVCDLVVAVLGKPESLGAEIPLSAPRAKSYREIIDLIGQVTGSKFEIETHTDEVPGIPPLVNSLWNLMNQLPDFDLDTEPVASTYGLELVTVEDFVKETFRAPGQ